MTTTHTPGPWRKSRKPRRGWGPSIEARNGHVLAEMVDSGPKGKANRDFILTACNHFDEMLGALRELTGLDPIDHGQALADAITLLATIDKEDA